MGDCYEIVGTSKDSINYMKLKHSSEEEIDRFIKEKYEDTKKRFERKISLTTLPEEKEEIAQQLKQIEDAYKKIKDEFSRRIYVRELNEGKEIDSSVVQINGKTPFEILEVNEKGLDLLSENEQDQYIKKQKDNLLRECEQQIEKLSDSRFTDKVKLITKIKNIREAYEEIKNTERRTKTMEQLQEERQKEEERRREQEIKETYSHISEYDISLIARTAKTEERMAIRQEVADSKEVCYTNKLNQEIRVRKIARILYCTSLGLKSHVNEYEVRRSLPEGEKVDVVKTGLNLNDLTLIKPEGLDCIINRLLSDDLILASKYNAGYIGEIEIVKEEVNKVKASNYDVTLKRKKLTPNEQEMLTAVMIIEEREQRQKEHENEGVAK